MIQNLSRDLKEYDNFFQIMMPIDHVSSEAEFTKLSKLMATLRLEVDQILLKITEIRVNL